MRSESSFVTKQNNCLESFSNTTDAVISVETVPKIPHARSAATNARQMPSVAQTTGLITWM